ncbi:hypothetical protein B0H21DRAFT_35713 [Amylocystis lapponica]|nr:hypothetical protein B0H21DRAFT_35713 [Amylocystis lapponica]
MDLLQSTSPNFPPSPHITSTPSPPYYTMVTFNDLNRGSRSNSEQLKADVVVFDASVSGSQATNSLPSPPVPWTGHISELSLHHSRREFDILARLLQGEAEMAVGGRFLDGWEARMERRLATELARVSDVASVPARAVVAPIAGPSRLAGVGAVAAAGPSRKRKRAAAVGTAGEEARSEKRKRTAETQDKENKPRAPRHPCLHEDCHKHIAGPVRDIKRHMDTHFHPRFWCPQCGERFGRADQLVEHFQANDGCGVRARAEPLAVDPATGRFKTDIFADPSHFTVLPGFAKLRVPEKGHLLWAEYSAWSRQAYPDAAPGVLGA